MPEHDFEDRFARDLQAYAEGGVRRTDPRVIAEAVVAGGQQDGRRFRWPAVRAGLRPVLALGLTVVLTSGALVAGSWSLERLTAIQVTPSPSPSPTPPPSASPARTADPSIAPAPTRPPIAAPCPAMLQLLQTWQGVAGSDPLPAASGPARGNGDVLMTGLTASGTVWVERIDPTQDPPVLVRGEPDGRVLPYAPGFPSSSTSRIVASPDGRAVAVEEGDPGQAGCGDPVVLLSAGGTRRPFPAGAFERVSDLAWAPDGSALHAVRRPTIDANGAPYWDADTGMQTNGPGTVLRWDTATGEVTDLGPGCGGCGPLFVSPDGTRLATTDGASVLVRDPSGTWRTVIRGDEPYAAPLLGWRDDGALVVAGTVVSLDGTELASWPRPPAHSWTVGPLSPDGTQVAGMTLSDDFLSMQVVLLDITDGTHRVLWAAPETRGCTAFDAGSSGRAGCEATSSEAPGATIDPAISLSGYAQVVAWAPDGSAVVLLDQQPDSAEASIRIVRADGSGASGPVTVPVPDLTSKLGFPNIGPAVDWMPAPGS